MTAHVPDDHTADVRDLLAELGELVGDLGLDEPAGAPAPAPLPAASKERRPRKRAAAPGGRRAAAVGGGAPRGGADSPAAEGAGAGVAASAAVTPAEAIAAAEAAEASGSNRAASTAPKRKPRRPAKAAASAPAVVLHLHREPLAADDAAELAELAAAVASDAPLTGADSADLIPLWESSADAPEHEPELVPLWDAFAPELDAEPPRAWSLEAAMEVVEPAAPPRAPGDPRAPVLLRLTRAVRPRIFTVTVVAAVLVALAVVVFSRLDLGQTTGPAEPVSKAAFAVTVMRTVDATSAATVAQAPTLSTFPAHTTQVYMDVAYRNATQGDRLRLVIDLLPPAGSGGNPVQVGDQTHPLPLGGEIAVTIQGPASGFSSGSYTVTAFHDGHLEQSLTFTVAAAPSATASPTP